MEEESLLFKEKENCAEVDGDLEHATSHVSPDCINDLLTNMGRFLSFLDKENQQKVDCKAQKGTRGEI